MALLNIRSDLLYFFLNLSNVDEICRAKVCHLCSPKKKKKVAAGEEICSFVLMSWRCTLP